MKHEDRIRLQHMLDAASDAVAFLGKLNPEGVEDNRLVSNAIVRSIEIVGEAASHIPDEFRISHREIPWQQIIGMRNRVVHAYFDIDFELVVSTVKYDLPPLIERLKKIISEYK